MVADKTIQTRVSNVYIYQGSLNPVMEGHTEIRSNPNQTFLNKSRSKDLQSWIWWTWPICS